MDFSLLFASLIIIAASGFANGLNVGLADPRHLKFLKAIVKLHDGATTSRPDLSIPPDFVTHAGDVSLKKAAVTCDYAVNFCDFHGTNLDGDWEAYVNNNTAVIDGPAALDGSPSLNVVHIISGELSGTKCMFFSTYSSSPDLSFAVSIIHGNSESTTPIPGGEESIKRITIGVGTVKPYRVIFHVYGAIKDKEFVTVERPTSGQIFIGKVRFVDGPCVRDVKTVNCTFDYSLCHWKLHSKKYIWYPVPFGRDHDVPHKIEWGALAAFGRNGGMWSPVVKSISTRCFTFIYAKGVSEQSYLRVWLLSKFDDGRLVRALLYEDVTFHKVIKKTVQINLFHPVHFQIAFEGQSKTILHGVIVLDTFLTEHRCKGIGFFSDVREIEFAPSGFPDFTLKPKITTGP